MIDEIAHLILLLDHYCYLYWQTPRLCPTLLLNLQPFFSELKKTNSQRFVTDPVIKSVDFDQIDHQQAFK